MLYYNDMNRRFLLSSALLFAAGSAAAQAKTKVVATFSILADLVEQVGASVRTKERWCFSVDSAAQDSSNEVTEEQTGYLGLAPI